MLERKSKKLLDRLLYGIKLVTYRWQAVAYCRRAHPSSNLCRQYHFQAITRFMPGINPLWPPPKTHHMTTMCQSSHFWQSHNCPAKFWTASNTAKETWAILGISLTAVGCKEQNGPICICSFSGDTTHYQTFGKHSNQIFWRSWLWSQQNTDYLGSKATEIALGNKTRTCQTPVARSCSMATSARSFTRGPPSIWMRSQCSNRFSACTSQTAR